MYLFMHNFVVSAPEERYIIKFRTRKCLTFLIRLKCGSLETYTGEVDTLALLFHGAGVSL